MYIEKRDYVSFLPAPRERRRWLATGEAAATTRGEA
jgi:hypothetical protein